MKRRPAFLLTDHGVDETVTSRARELIPLLRLLSLSSTERAREYEKNEETAASFFEH